MKNTTKWIDDENKFNFELNYNSVADTITSIEINSSFDSFMINVDEWDEFKKIVIEADRKFEEFKGYTGKK